MGIIWVAPSHKRQQLTAALVRQNSKNCTQCMFYIMNLIVHGLQFLLPLLTCNFWFFLYRMTPFLLVVWWCDLDNCSKVSSNCINVLYFTVFNNEFHMKQNIHSWQYTLLAPECVNHCCLVTFRYQDMWLEKTWRLHNILLWQMTRLLVNSRSGGWSD